MKKSILFILTGVIIGCSSSDPREMGKEVCQCKVNAEKYENSNRQESEMNNCLRLQQKYIDRIRRNGVNNDLSDKEVNRQLDILVENSINCNN